MCDSIETEMKPELWETAIPTELVICGVITKYHRLGGINNKTLLQMALEAEKSKIKVPANSVSMKSVIHGLWTLVFSLWMFWGRSGGLVHVPSHKDTNCM